MKPRAAIPIIFILALALGFFVFSNQFKQFKFGLDIKGGSHLVYEADTSQIAADERDEAMAGLRDVIERRINLFGVAEPVVAVSKTGESQRLTVELAGVLDVGKAIELIGATPYLEFREQGEADFIPTQLTGRFLKRAQLSFDQQTARPLVLLEFNGEGAKIFAEITKRNIGRQLAIYLDGAILSAPVVEQEIAGGNAQITGDFSISEARSLVENLNAGALPVPISLISQQTVGAALGEESLNKSLFAGLAGFSAVALFMILYYRLAGTLAVGALLIYTVIVLSIFKLLPVTLTLAGIVGFILSVGMAVDANILVFERMKEELRAGRAFGVAIEEGFRRAWLAIRDAYTSTLLTSLVLYWFGTSLVRGFALTLALGLLVALFSALVITKTFLRGVSGTQLAGVKGLWKQ